MCKTKIYYWESEEGLSKISKWIKEDLNDCQIAKNMNISYDTFREYVKKEPKIYNTIMQTKYGKYIENGYVILNPQHNTKKNVRFLKNNTVYAICRVCKKLIESDKLIEYKCKECHRTINANRRKSEEAKEKIRERSRRYYKENKEKVYKNIYKRHTRIHENEYDYSEKEWQFTLSAFNNECAYCGRNDVKLEREHIIPVSKGGAYVIKNIIPACHSCNMSKLNRPMEEWYKQQKYYDDERFMRIKKWSDINAD